MHTHTQTCTELHSEGKVSRNQMLACPQLGFDPHWNWSPSK